MKSRHPKWLWRFSSSLWPLQLGQGSARGQLHQLFAGRTTLLNVQKCDCCLVVFGRGSGWSCSQPCGEQAQRPALWAGPLAPSGRRCRGACQTTKVTLMCWVSARRLESAHNRIILLRVVGDESSIEPCGVEAGLAQASFRCSWGRERGGVQRCLVRRLLHRGRFRRQR